MKLAIFDIDGTLTDSHGYDAHFFAALAEALGLDEYEGLLSAWSHVTDEAIAYDFFEHHGVTATEDDVERVKLRYEAALREHMHGVAPMPGAESILAFLRSRDDWCLAIATGNWTGAGVMKLAAGGLDASDIPVIGCDGRPSREELMEHALHVSREAHGAFEHVVYIGDAPWDVNATRALGWNFLGLNADRERLLDLGATHVIADYHDLDATHAALLAADVPR